MLYNISHRPNDVLRKIDEAVGPSPSLFQRLCAGTQGSPRYLLSTVSPSMTVLFSSTLDRRFFNIEMRPYGIIVHFHHRLEVFAWPIPFHLLGVYQNGTKISIHGAGDFIKGEMLDTGNAYRKFMIKLLEGQNATVGRTFQGTGS